jgi:hypothetical protein
MNEFDYSPQVDPVEDFPVSLKAALEGRTHALIQGYPYSGLVRIVNEDLEFPPGWSAPSADQWQQFWDIRVFGKQSGEVHFWRTGIGWSRRTAHRRSDDTNRQYPLWGTYKRSEAVWHLFEDTGRGIEVWLPAELVPNPQPDAYACLAVRLVIAREIQSGLAQIVDSYIEEVQPWPTK